LINTLKKADYILLTHAHGDLSWMWKNCKRTNAVIVSNAEIAGYAKEFQAHPMNQSAEVGFDFRK
jgi:glyoxylase-like metal-dependent hydrolase (beta-lactamase superfamily II)